jgi:lysine biosynthesis protein LysW
MAIVRVTCRSCGREIALRREPQLGSRVVCPGCGTKLEVIGLTPLELDWAFDDPLGEAASDVLMDDPAAEGGPGR